MYVSVLEGGFGGALGVNGGWLPLPTRPQRYCDPASLVLCNFVQLFGFIFGQLPVWYMFRFPYSSISQSVTGLPGQLVGQLISRSANEMVNS